MPLKETLDSVTGDMPEPQPHAIEAERKEEEQRAEETKDLRDRRGRPFDPRFHKTDATGNPVLNVDGTLRAKPGGAGISAAKADTARSQLNVETQSKPLPDTAMTPEQQGRVATALTINIGVALGGEDFMPIKDPSIGKDEERELINAYSKYFESLGITDIPPGWALAFTLGAYVFPRFSKPKVQRRGVGLWRWIKLKYVRWQIRRAGHDPDEILDNEGNVKTQPEKKEA